MKFPAGVVLGAVFGVLLGALAFRGPSGELAPAPPATGTAAPAAKGADSAVPAAEEGEPEPPKSDGAPGPPAATRPLADVMFEAFVAVAAPKGSLGREEVLARMRREREEAIALLESWIRRGPELEGRGISLARICYAYADLAGRDAVPLLAERLALDRSTPITALARIDDPAAAEAIRRFAEGQPGNISPRNFTPVMAAGSEAAREVVRHWAFGPTNRFTVSARLELFLRGAETDRDRVWSSTLPAQRIHFDVSDDWPAPWPARRVEAIRSALASEDPGIRWRGCQRAAEMTGDLPPELVSEALAIVERDLAAGKAENGRGRFSDEMARDRLRLAVERREKDAENRDWLLR